MPTAVGSYSYKVVATNTIAASCKDSVSVNLVINGNPDATLMVSDPQICEGADADIMVTSSVLGVSYQLRLNSDDSTVGSAIAGTGSDITFTISSLTQSATTYDYNVYATNSTTGCATQLTDLAMVRVDNCDFPDFSFAIPACVSPPCHILSTDIYIGSGGNS